MERNKTKIKEKDINNWVIPKGNNKVIIEITERTKDKQTKGGIHLGFNEDTVYAEGDGSHEAEVAETWGYVAAVPSELYFNKRDPHGMQWDTDIEIKVGDMVWFSYFASVNCDVLIQGERTFYVIGYDDLHVAVRGDNIIPLNGYCLCELIEKPQRSDLIQEVETHYEDNKVLVRHVGQANRAYFSTSGFETYHNDNIDVCEGDIVILRKGYPLSKLELLKEISTFSDKEYYIVQRRFMEMVVDGSDD